MSKPETTGGWDPEAQAATEDAEEDPGFVAFLLQNWLWWAVPFVTIMVLLFVLLYISSDKTVVPFFYALTD